MDRVRVVGRALRLRDRTRGWLASARSVSRARSLDARLARYALPAASLAVVTAVVLVVRLELRSREPVAPTEPTTARAARPRPHSVRRRVSGVRPPVVGARSYVIRSGDTLEGIATRTGTSVAALLRLNPGVRPASLQPGQSIRVR